MQVKKGLSLYDYVKFYLANSLNKQYSLDDCRGFVICEIAKNKQLEGSFKTNTIPSDPRDLSLLRAIISRAKLNWLDGEYCHRTGLRKSAIKRKIIGGQSVNSFVNEQRKIHDELTDMDVYEFEPKFLNVVLSDEAGVVIGLGTKTII